MAFTSVELKSTAEVALEARVSQTSGTGAGPPSHLDWVYPRTSAAFTIFSGRQSHHTSTSSTYPPLSQVFLSYPRTEAAPCAWGGIWFQYSM